MWYVYARLRTCMNIEGLNSCAQMLDVLTQPLDSGKREVVVVESSKAISHTWKKEEDDDDEEIIAKPAAPKRGNKGGTNNSKKTAAPAMHFEVQETPAKFAKPCAGFDVFCGSAERMYEQGVGDDLDKFMVRVSWCVCVDRCFDWFFLIFWWFRNN